MWSHLKIGTVVDFHNGFAVIHNDALSKSLKGQIGDLWSDAQDKRTALIQILVVGGV